ncbi:hypothetical protein SDC9_179087 [bioreactor metagenome]|uniref:Uncharacterized protein n=1 Tax=bioreactor metagenome TaxID=1076179 RepID=A0A645H722_9ZZZZ
MPICNQIRHDAAHCFAHDALGQAIANLVRQGHGEQRFDEPVIQKRQSGFDGKRHGVPISVVQQRHERSIQIGVDEPPRTLEIKAVPKRLNLRVSHLFGGVGAYARYLALSANLLDEVRHQRARDELRAKTKTGRIERGLSSLVKELDFPLQP